MHFVISKLYLQDFILIFLHSVISKLPYLESKNCILGHWNAFYPLSILDWYWVCKTSMSFSTWCPISNNIIRFNLILMSSCNTPFTVDLGFSNYLSNSVDNQHPMDYVCIPHFPWLSYVKRHKTIERGGESIITKLKHKTSNTDRLHNHTNLLLSMNMKCR